MASQPIVAGTASGLVANISPVAANNVTVALRLNETTDSATQTCTILAGQTSCTVATGQAIPVGTLLDVHVSAPDKDDLNNRRFSFAFIMTPTP
jgi:hypothetical protein